ncbi:MAG: hypothetical protein ACRDL8_23320 [Solirubrobacteraceae bacterium]
MRLGELHQLGPQRARRLDELVVAGIVKRTGDERGTRYELTAAATAGSVARSRGWLKLNQFAHVEPAARTPL